MFKIDSRVEAILFDAEGVVIDTEPLWDKSQELLMEGLGLSYDRELLKPKLAGQTILEGVQTMKEIYNLQEDKRLLAKTREVLIHRLFENDICWIDGFLAFFEQVKIKKLRYCIATSMQKDLMIKINAKLKLDDLFEGRVYHISDVGNKSKPEPDIFLFSAKKLKVAPENCLVIEDSPHGIKAAKRRICIA